MSPQSPQQDGQFWDCYIIPHAMGMALVLGFSGGFAFRDTWMSSLIPPRCEQGLSKPLEQEQVSDPALNQ